ncbi:nuclear transport factor 2 family protein [Roseomonas sp. CAU 1739]|uniref:nuclear transport factor 2 family protein n=1 Tax=Roseomonas sp. CAU 1739 TaxID=3140364 RepID=UPI00325BE599
MNIMRRTGVVGLAAMAVGLPRGIAHAAAPAEARPLFERFVASQNAHDATAVEAMLWNSQDFLWITRGAAIWGREAATERFRALYRGTWRLEPEMAQFRAMSLGEGTAQLFVPVLFTIGAAGQPAQPAPFLMNQVLRRDGSAWQIASIMPIALPPS